MATEILKSPDPILLHPSEPIKKITPKVKEIAEEMIDFMDIHSSDNSKPVGLSACQLGHSIRMFAFRRSPQSLDRNDVMILINPEMVYGKGQYLVYESCLSLPGRVYQLKRFKLVKTRGITLDGTSRSFRVRDLLGQVFQHELNHLDGILINQIGSLVVG